MEIHATADTNAPGLKNLGKGCKDCRIIKRFSKFRTVLSKNKQFSIHRNSCIECEQKQNASRYRDKIYLQKLTEQMESISHENDQLIEQNRYLAVCLQRYVTIIGDKYLSPE